MVVSNGDINIIGDLEGTGSVRLHNNRQKLRQRFDIIRKLGQGTYGKVQLAINKDSQEEVAIKTIKKAKIETEQDLVRIQREIQIMSSVQHPHIIHIYEVFENKEKIVLVMEYANGGELYDYLYYKKVLDECEARRIFRQVVSAVFYCHKNNICHRDLKLENILLDEKGNAKIADFGLSNVFDKKRLLSSFCGSPLYASPEIVKGTPYYGPEVDCWSLGVLLYTLVYGSMPFDGSNFRRLVKQISEGDYSEPKKQSDASLLIRRMLTVPPAKRAAIEQICQDWWVNQGYDQALLDVSEELCQEMPVRLDYLLALVPADGAKTGTDANLNKNQDDTVPSTTAGAESDAMNKYVAGSASAPILSAAEKGRKQENLDNQGEQKQRGSMTDDQPMEISEVFDDGDDATSIGVAAARKHKLGESGKSLKGTESTDRVSIKKKQRREDGGKVAVEIGAAKRKSTSSKNGDRKEITAGAECAAVSPEMDEAGKIVADNYGRNDENEPAGIKEEKLQTSTKDLGNEKASANFKELEINNKSQESVLKETKVIGLSLDSGKDVQSEPRGTPGEADKMDVDDHETGKETTKDPKVDSTKIEADKKLATRRRSSIRSGSKLVDDSAAALTFTAGNASPRKSITDADKDKKVFTALKVSDTRKAFEAKPADKVKSLVIPGLKTATKKPQEPHKTPSKSSIIKPKSGDEQAKVVEDKVVIKSEAKDKVKERSPKAKSTSPGARDLKGSLNGKQASSTKSQNTTSPPRKGSSSSDVSGADQLKQKQQKIASPPKGVLDEKSTVSAAEAAEPPPSPTTAAVTQKKTAGFLPTLDVTMDVKPAARRASKPPHPPRTEGAGNASGSSSGDSTPDALSQKHSTSSLKSPLKDASLQPKSPLGLVGNRRSSVGKPSIPSQVKGGDQEIVDDKISSNSPRLEETSSPVSIASTEESSPTSSTSTIIGSGRASDLGKASSQDIGGSETSFLARAFPKKSESKVGEEPQPTKLNSTIGKPKKTTSMEIMLNSQPGSPSEETKPTDQVPERAPQPLLSLGPSSSNKKLTLLGVKSEVSFNVSAAPPTKEELEADAIKKDAEHPHIEARRKAPENKSLYFAVTLPAPNSQAAMNRSIFVKSPERVIPSPSDVDLSGADGRHLTPERTVPTQTKVDRVQTKPPPKPTDTPRRQRERIIPIQVEDSTKTEQRRRRKEVLSEDETSETSRRGYGVYRSKFRSTHKAFVDECGSISDVDPSEEAPTPPPLVRQPSLERSESFSSTGSTDDLEDIFFAAENSMAGDSMLTNLLSRTRNILEQLTQNEVTSTRRLGSMLGRISLSSSPRYERASDRIARVLDQFSPSSSSRTDPFERRTSDTFSDRSSFSRAATRKADNTSGLGSSWSSRTASRQTSCSSDDATASDSHDTPTFTRRSSWRSSIHEDPDYFSDSGLASPRKSRVAANSRDWNSSFSRSVGCEEERDASDSNTTMRSACSTARRSTFNSSYSRSSVSSSIEEEEANYGSMARKRDETASLLSRYSRPSRDSSSATLQGSSSANRYSSWRQKGGDKDVETASSNSSVGSRYSRTQSEERSAHNFQREKYRSSFLRSESLDRASSDVRGMQETAKQRGLFSHDSADSGLGTLPPRRASDSTGRFLGRQNRSEASSDDVSSLYGTLRRPRSFIQQQAAQRYTSSRSISHELPAVRDSSDRRDSGFDHDGMRRPRSVLVLSDPDADTSTAGDTSQGGDDDDTVSLESGGSIARKGFYGRRGGGGSGGASGTGGANSSGVGGRETMGTGGKMGMQGSSSKNFSGSGGNGQCCDTDIPVDSNPEAKIYAIDYEASSDASEYSGDVSLAESEFPSTSSGYAVTDHSDQSDISYAPSVSIDSSASVSEPPSPDISEAGASVKLKKRSTEAAPSESRSAAARDDDKTCTRFGFKTNRSSNSNLLPRESKSVSDILSSLPSASIRRNSIADYLGEMNHGLHQSGSSKSVQETTLSTSGGSATLPRRKVSLPFAFGYHYGESSENKIKIDKSASGDSNVDKQPSAATIRHQTNRQKRHSLANYDDLDDEAKRGAAGYWARRYGNTNTTERIPPTSKSNSTSSHPSIENPRSMYARSKLQSYTSSAKVETSVDIAKRPSKYDDRWVGSAEEPILANSSTGVNNAKPARMSSSERIKKRYGHLLDFSSGRSETPKIEDEITANNVNSATAGYGGRKTLTSPSRLRDAIKDDHVASARESSDVTDDVQISTKGLLRYARSISSELDRLQVDLCSRFGFENISRSSKSTDDNATSTSVVQKREGNPPSSAPPPLPPQVAQTIGEHYVKTELPKDDADGVQPGTSERMGEKIQPNTFDTEDPLSCVVDLDPPLAGLNEFSGSTPDPSVSPTSDIPLSFLSSSIDSASNDLANSCPTDGTITPTDADDVCSVCSSDFNDCSSRIGGLIANVADDESVSERIRRKSYYSRFQENRSSRSQMRKNLDPTMSSSSGGDHGQQQCGDAAHHQHSTNSSSLMDNTNKTLPRMLPRKCSLYSSSDRESSSTGYESLEHGRCSRSQTPIRQLDDRSSSSDKKSANAQQKRSIAYNDQLVDEGDSLISDRSSSRVSDLLDDAVRGLDDMSVVATTTSPRTTSPDTLSSSSMYLRSMSLPTSEFDPGGLSASYLSFMRRHGRSPADSNSLHRPVSPRLSLIPENGDRDYFPSSSRNASTRSSYVAPPAFPDTMGVSASPRAKLRSRHDYVIQRALSSIEGTSPIMPARSIVPPSRRTSSLLDNNHHHSPDIRQFSALLDSTHNPRDMLRKAIELCTSLQY